MNTRSKFLLFLLATSTFAQADVSIDGSLGGVPGSAVTSGNGFTYDITPSYGQVNGQNLYHSFDQFNVDIGEQANFSGVASIENIIARVTGGESQIAGGITSTIDTASLWLVNSSGFVFTNGATIDVDGALNLSTADYLSFMDGARFYSTLSPMSTLTSAPVTSFGFVAESRGSISIDSSRAIPGEDKSSGQNLNVNSEFILIQEADFIAQDINIRMGDAGFGDIEIVDTILESVEGGIFFQGGNIYAVDSVITASGPNSEVVVATNSLTLEGDLSSSVIQTGNLQASGGPITIDSKDVLLTNNAALISSSGGNNDGGSIFISVDSLVVENNSHIDLAAGENSSAGDLSITAQNVLINNQSSLNTSGGLPGTTAGNIDINVVEQFLLQGNSILLAESASTGEGGGVSITAGDVIVREGSALNVQNRGAGSASTLQITANNDLLLDQNSNINISSSGDGDGGIVTLKAETITLDSLNVVGAANGEGTGGVILIDGNDVFITNGSAFNVSSFSTAATAGDAGTVSIRGERITIDGNSNFQLVSAGGGLGGVMDIKGGDIVLEDIVVEAAARGAGQGGDFLVQGDTISIDRININASVEGAGLGGAIRLDAPLLNLSNTNINLTATGQGDAGDLELVGNQITLTQVNVNASVDGSGLGGAVRFEGGDISLVDTGINITARGPGDAGDFVATGDSFTMSGASGNGIFGDTRGDGRGADIFLNTDIVSISDTAITSGTFGQGKGGLIQIASATSIDLSNTLLSSQSEGDGIGGNILVSTGVLAISGTSNVNVSATGSADAGHIDLNVTSATITDSSRFSLTASGTGVAGLLTVNADSLTFSDQSSVVANVSQQAEGDLLQFNTGQFNLLDESQIRSDTKGTGVGGTIDINTGSLTISDKASLNAEALAQGDAGLIDIRADSILLAGGSIITTTRGDGFGGIIQINAETLIANESATLSSDSLSAGGGGDIILNVKNVELDNTQLNAVARGDGDGGAITVNAGSFEMTNGSLINVSALSGTGNAGFITLKADELSINADSTIALSTQTNGDAGVLTIQAAQLSIDDSTIRGETQSAGTGSDILIVGSDIRIVDSQINSATTATGLGGVVSIDGGNVDISNSAITAETRGSANGGSINISAGSLSIVDRANLNAATRGGLGNAGDIKISANDFTMDQGLILLVTESTGMGGQLDIDADSIVLTAGSTITASAFGDGDAGIVTITAGEIDISGQTTLESDTSGLGVGGDILLQATNLNLTTGSVISSSSTGASDAGDISLEIASSLKIIDSVVRTTSDNAGGGNIDIQAIDLIQIDNSTVSATANGLVDDSNGGNISIDPELFTIRQSSIIAQANAGSGGNINLFAVNLITDTESTISASSQRGIDGVVEIESPNQAANPVVVDLNSGFQNLPEFVSKNCSNPGLADRSYLVVDNLNPVRRNPSDNLPIFSKPTTTDASVSVASTLGWQPNC